MLTFDQVNEHVENLDIGEMSVTTRAAAKATPEEVVGKICGVYQKARPVLEFLANFGWIIPEKWRAVLRATIIQLDKICPQS